MNPVYEKIKKKTCLKLIVHDTLNEKNSKWKLGEIHKNTLKDSLTSFTLGG